MPSPQMQCVVAVATALWGENWMRPLARLLGIHRETPRHWLRGRGGPSHEHMYQLAHAARTHFTDILAKHDALLESLRLETPPPPPPPPPVCHGAAPMPAEQVFDGGPAPKLVSNLHAAPRDAGGRLLPTGPGSRGPAPKSPTPPDGRVRDKRTHCDNQGRGTHQLPSQHASATAGAKQLRMLRHGRMVPLE
jgi:hypothetical protein